MEMHPLPWKQTSCHVDMCLNHGYMPVAIETHFLTLRSLRCNGGTVVAMETDITMDMHSLPWKCTHCHEDALVAMETPLLPWRLLNCHGDAFVAIKTEKLPWRWIHHHGYAPISMVPLLPWRRSITPEEACFRRYAWGPFGPPVHTYLCLLYVTNPSVHLYYDLLAGLYFFSIPHLSPSVHWLYPLELYLVWHIWSTCSCLVRLVSLQMLFSHSIYLLYIG